MTTVDIGTESPESVGQLIERRSLGDQRQSVQFAIDGWYNYLELHVKADTGSGSGGRQRVLPQFNGDTNRSNYTSYQLEHDTDVAGEKHFDGKAFDLSVNDDMNTALTLRIAGIGSSEAHTTFAVEYSRHSSKSLQKNNVVVGWYDDTDEIQSVSLLFENTDARFNVGSEFALVGVE